MNNDYQYEANNPILNLIKEEANLLIAMMEQININQKLLSEQNRAIYKLANIIETTQSNVDTISNHINSLHKDLNTINYRSQILPYLQSRNVINEYLLTELLTLNGYKGRVCPICGESSVFFNPFGTIIRPNAKCPKCDSAERHRYIWLYLQREYHIHQLEKEIKLLHFAAEISMQKYFRMNDKIDYFPVDIDPNYPGIRDIVDITNIQYENNIFDLIICSHVLEHIEDEEKALTEMMRVLKPDGIAIICIPTYNIENTLENNEYNTPSLRFKHYGEINHVRRYGLDAMKRFIDYGFSVELMKFHQDLSNEEQEIFGLIDGFSSYYILRNKDFR